MITSFLRAAPILIAAAFGGTTAFAQGEEAHGERGRTLYLHSCAVCHGVTGKGDGPYQHFIPDIPDLTVLAKRNGGVFPVAQVYEIIDGRREVKAHGPREMPIWGMQYNIEATEMYGDIRHEQEVLVRNRILHLIEYLYQLQE
jgi:mono/diheme cytochrome c family protein